MIKRNYRIIIQLKVYYAYNKYYLGKHKPYLNSTIVKEIINKNDNIVNSYNEFKIHYITFNFIFKKLYRSQEIIKYKIKC